jgi:uncharacterized alkaline shock family protein YloU
VGIVDRIILTLYTVALTVLSLLAVAVAFGWSRPLDTVLAALRATNGRAAVATVGAIFFLSSVRLLILAFRRRQPGQQVVHETELGEVRISLDAVENLVRRVARQATGVRDVRPQVRLAPEGVEARLRVWVSPDVSIPGVARELQDALRRSVHEVVGVELAALDVQVENVTTEVRRGRVE